MKKNRKTGFHVLQVVLIAFAAILLITLLVITWMSENAKITETRQLEETVRISEYTCEETEKKGTPLGYVEDYTFTVPETLDCDTTLNFYLVHQYVQVYLNEECVYRIDSSGSLPMIKTPGCNWVTIPVYREDAGKEVHVVVIPVYQNIRSRTVTFLLGPKENVILAQLAKEWIPNVLSEVLIVFGILLLGFSVYYIKIYKNGWELVSYGALSICMGLWGYFDMSSMQLMVSGRSVFMFYLSVGMMMFGMIPFMLSIRHKMKKSIIDFYSIVVASMCIVFTVVQLCGIADLREFLWVIHLISIVGLILTLFQEILRYKKEHVRITVETFTLFSLIAGAITDIVIYYVKPAFEVPYFILIALFFSLLAVSISHMINYSRQEQKLMKQENQIIHSRVSAATGQINSHFVFNVLNAISGMCKYDPEKADRTITCFSRYLRANIDIMQEDHPVFFQSALVLLRDYIELEKIRFGEKIRFEEQIEVEQFYIPSLVLQPLVENAIVHGLKPKQEGGTIILKTWVERDIVKISVEDDGVGFDTDLVSSQSVGIQNVRFRLRYMMNGQLDIISKPACGTKATITLPLVEKIGNLGGGGRRMHIIYVDDEKPARDNFCLTVSGMPEVESLQLFENGESALDYVKTHTVDVAFLDMQMEGLHGLGLALILHEICENIRIVFVTAYSQYALAAWKVNAMGYVLKPYTAEDIQKELEKCVFRPLPSRRIVIQTIPTLTISVDGKPVYISGKKTRELFALLVERAEKGLTTGEGISCLWPERPNDPKTQSLFRMTYKRLLTKLEEEGIGHIILSSGNRRYLRVEEVDCDLYRILSGDKQAATRYNGQFLDEYSWAEERNGQLYRMLIEPK